MRSYKTMPRDEDPWEDDPPTLGRVKNQSSFSSLRNASFLFPTDALQSSRQGLVDVRSSSRSDDSVETKSSKPSFVVYIIIYGMVNSIMGIPCMYGYAAVIFNNPAFNAYTNELSKVVLWSSVIHQFCFSISSSLPFAIGQVQDAGLIFLSHMANTMANKITADGGSQEEVLSTCLVILTLATFATGIILILLGKFRLADLVSYLPYPVVGGYLAFIGYFCGQAGVSLCISKPMIGLKSWELLWNEHEFLLALPGILTGLLFTCVIRTIQNESALPIMMVVVPVVFYMVIFFLGMTLDDARSYGWIGESSPPVLVKDLFTLIDLSKVHWMLAMDCFSTWIGMVFVVSFSSCLDVAAISLDMGVPLDVNNELTTVGISNAISGLTMGFTGSYIFSQTIFTSKTGVHSRWVGVFMACAEIVVIISPVNLLEVVPLFFLGSTLIFIAVDLLYEWLIEVRHKILLSEYCVLIITFISIHILGINNGVVFGLVVSIVDYVLKSARVSSITRVAKRSRAVWRPDQWKLLTNHGYRIQNPKIVTFEIKGTVFFGSSLQILTCLSQELSLNAGEDDLHVLLMASPGPHRGSAASPARNGGNNRALSKGAKTQLIVRPRFVVFDLSQVPNIDSSAARGCFYQLSKICARYNVVLCASGANTRVDWVLRSHEAAYKVEEEDEAKAKASSPHEVTNKIILFETIFEALEFCESNLISEMQPAARQGMTSPLTKRVVIDERISLKDAFVHILGLKQEEEAKLKAFEDERGPFHDEIVFHSGDAIFQEGDYSDAFFVVLGGSVALFESGRTSSNFDVLSGAGSVRSSRSSSLGDVGAFIPTGGVFGFVDYVLDQPRLFSAVSAKDKTFVAKLHREGLSKLKAESPELDRILDRVLLQVSIQELVNSQAL